MGEIERLTDEFWGEICKKLRELADRCGVKIEESPDDKEKSDERKEEGIYE